MTTQYLALTGVSEDDLHYPDRPEDPPSAPHSIDPETLICDLPLTIDEWPLELPPKPLMLHLVDIFFTYYPNSRRILHRPTFMIQILANPTLTSFPFIPLLHAICAAAAIYSPLVETVPPPCLHADNIFPGQTLVDRGHNLSFEEQHIILCEYQCRLAAREGENLLSVIQCEYYQLSRSCLTLTSHHRGS
jgi:hypothetical protein